MLIEMAVEENDEEGFVAVQEDVAGLEKQMADLEFKRMFNQPADPNNCFIDITAGAGGTEAEDWAGMLFRMYSRYAERKGFKIEILEEDDGEIAGINRATIRVEGEYAYGLLRTETGVHRLVRYSPFDSNNKRHTSFSSVFVYPEIDDSIEIEINPADLRIDTYRASGAGGQHINKTDSAVRITHEPTGIVVQCQNDRSQHANKAAAWNVEIQTVRIGNAQTQRRETGIGRRQVRCGLGQPNPLIRFGFLTHQRLAYRLRSRQHQSRIGRRLGRLHRSQPEARRINVKHKMPSERFQTAFFSLKETLFCKY